MSAAQWQIISHIPQKGMTGAQWGMAIEIGLIKLWTAVMPIEECRNLARDADGGPIIDRVPAHLFARLDEIILEQAETLGWRIRLSLLVQRRLSEWDHEKRGPEKLAKLGAAEVRAAKTLQRRKGYLPPIKDPDQWLVKKETVEELRIVLERLRAAFALRRNTPAPREAHELFSSTVHDSAELFPHLMANLDRWQQFHANNPDELIPLITSNRPKPAELYDSFLSWCTGWDSESLRQAISRLGSAKL